MLQRIFRLVAVLLVCSGATTAHADSSARPPIEKAQAISGFASTVIGRVFLGDGGNLSYLRFLNLSGNTATMSATLIGSPSGRNYGTTQVTIANHASKQIAVTDLLSAIGLVGPTSPDDRIGIYLASDAAPVAAQHRPYSQST